MSPFVPPNTNPFLVGEMQLYSNPCEKGSSFEAPEVFSFICDVSLSNLLEI